MSIPSSCKTTFLFIYTLLFLSSSLILLYYSGGFIPVIFSIFVLLLARKYPKTTLNLFFLTLPIINLISNIFFKYHAIPSILITTSGWLTGYLCYILSDRQNNIITPPMRIFYLIISLLIFLAISSVYSFGQYFKFLPNLEKVITVHIDGKEVILKNALGWIMLGFLQWSAGPLFFLLYFDYLKRLKDKHGVIPYIYVGILLSLLVMIYQYYNKSFANHFPYDNYRLNGGFFDPNSAAAFLFLFLALMQYAKNIPQKLFLLAITLFGILSTGNRTLSVISLLFTIVAIHLYLKSTSGISQKTKYILISIIIIIGFILSATLLPTIRNRILTNNKLIIPSFYTERIIYWKNAVVIFSDNFLMGTGVGRYLLVLPDYLRKMTIIPWNSNENACNYYLQIAAELGIGGIILWVGILISLLLNIIKKILLNNIHQNNQEKNISFNLLLFLIILLTGNYLNFIEVAVLFWMEMAMVYDNVNNN